MPDLRGRLTANASLADITWFRVGGPAQVLFTPADEADLAYFLQTSARRRAGLRHRSRLQPAGARRRRAGRRHPPRPRLRRDQGRARHRIRAGTAVPDVKVARAAADAGIAGLAFYRGIPGSIGGALRMNAGAHGRETKDVLDRGPRRRSRRQHPRALASPTWASPIAIAACPTTGSSPRRLYQGTPGDPAEILKEMDEVAEYREKNQPIKERTGGSTFKNPPGHSAWKLIDEAGCRGFRVGGAKVSEMHCNFLINDRRRHRRGRRAPGRDGARARQGASRA